MEKGIIRTVVFQTINHDARKGEEEAFLFPCFPWSFEWIREIHSSLWRIGGLLVLVELPASTWVWLMEREKTAILFSRFDPIKEEEPAFSLHEGVHKGTIDPPPRTFTRALSRSRSCSLIRAFAIHTSPYLLPKSLITIYRESYRE